MQEICPVCGLPKELCICGEVPKDTIYLRVYKERRRYGKFVTIIDGFEDIEYSQLKSLASDLKKMLGTGGSAKNNQILLQGNKVKECKSLLKSMGWSIENEN